MLRALHTACLFAGFGLSLVNVVMWLHAMPLAVAGVLGLGGEPLAWRVAVLLGFLLVAPLGALIAWWCLAALDEPWRYLRPATLAALLYALIVLASPAQPAAGPAEASLLHALAFWATRPREFLLWLFGERGIWVLLAQPLLLGVALATLRGEQGTPAGGGSR
jgi:hypothetical protein